MKTYNEYGYEFEEELSFRRGFLISNIAEWKSTHFWIRRVPGVMEFLTVRKKIVDLGKMII